MVIASFSIIPIGVGVELKEFIAEIISLVDESGLNYKLGAMQTTIEGEMVQVMDVIMKCHNLMKKRAPRVYTSITIDDRGELKNRLEGKVKDVETQLGREVKHE